MKNGNGIDQGKVICGLEFCLKKGCEAGCPYYDTSEYMDGCLEPLLTDALSLLNAQETDIKMLSEKYADLLDRSLEMQEPVQVGEQIVGFDDVLDFYSCGFCKNAVRKPWNYCPFCGRKVKWE